MAEERSEGATTEGPSGHRPWMRTSVCRALGTLQRIVSSVVVRRRAVCGVFCINRNVAMPESTSLFAIRVSDLMVGFGRHVVIDHLSRDVRRGEILGLVGASGGGKSVLMRTIIGLIRRQSGEIEVMGAAIGGAQDRSTQSAAGRWGILFQQGALFSSLTVRQTSSFRCAKIWCCRIR
jgi:ABC-type multidrug transport system fused ATPase/permease subunit